MIGENLIARIIELVPANYPGREDLVEDLTDLDETDDIEDLPTIEEVRDCIRYYLGPHGNNVPWKIKIAELLKG